MKRFRMFTHFYAASFSMKVRFFMKLGTFFILSARSIFKKLLAISDVKKMIMKKVRSYWILFVILLNYKLAKLHLLESTLKCLKAGQKSYPYHHPISNNDFLKFLKTITFLRTFFS